MLMVLIKQALIEEIYTLRR